MLTAKNIFKSFSQKNEIVKVFDGLNMNVQRGKIYCLMGSSGIGKTTLITCILGVTPLDSGEIKTAVKASNIGYMPQSLNLSSNLTIKEMLEFYAKINGSDEKTFAKRFSMLGELLEFPSSDQLIGKCSGGEKRRISLAAAFIHDPALVILDEPTVGLDHFLRIKIWNFIRQQVDDHQTTIILSTHYTNEANISDRIGIIQNGKIIVEASPRDILKKSKKESLNDAILDLYENQESLGNVESTTEIEEIVEVKKDKKQLIALMTKDLRIMKRNPLFNLMTIFFPIIAILIFAFSFGKIPKDLKLFVRTSLNCSNQFSETFNIPCWYIDELHKMPFFQLVTDKNEKVYATLEFKNLLNLTCEESFNALDMFEMKNAFLIVEFSEKSYVNDIFKNIFFLAYQKMTKKIFDKCDFTINERTLNVVDVNEKEIEMKYNGSGFYMMTNLIIFGVSVGLFFFWTVSNRNDGTWNHTILSGITTRKIFFAYFLVYLPTLVIEVLLFKLLTWLLMEWSSFRVDLLVILMIVVGMLFGMLMTFFTNDTGFICSFVFLLSMSVFALGGFFEPIESLPDIPKFISYFGPFTMPSIAGFQCQTKAAKCSSSFISAIQIQTFWILLFFVLILLCSIRKNFISKI